MCGEKEKLACRKKIRTYSKRLVTALSTVLLIGYIATLVFNISIFSLHFAIVGTILSAISLALNMWSLTDHFRKRELDKKCGIENTSEQKKKIVKISLDIASSISFSVGGVTSLISNTVTLSLQEASIIYFVSASLFILGYIIMGVSIVRWLTDSKLEIEENNNVEVKRHSFSKIGQAA